MSPVKVRRCVFARRGWGCCLGVDRPTSAQGNGDDGRCGEDGEHNDAQHVDDQIVGEMLRNCRLQCWPREWRPPVPHGQGRFRTEARRTRAALVSGLPCARNVPIPDVPSVTVDERHPSPEARELTRLGKSRAAVVLVGVVDPVRLHNEPCDPACMTPSLPQSSASRCYVGHRPPCFRSACGTLHLLCGGSLPSAASVPYPCGPRRAASTAQSVVRYAHYRVRGTAAGRALRVDSGHRHPGASVLRR